MRQNTTKFQSFDCEEEPIPNNTPGVSRHPERSCLSDLADAYHAPSIQFFDCEVLHISDDAVAVQT